jgi:hypothetical protein
MATPENQLVYGILGDNLVIIREEEAIRWARKWEAIQSSETWADFIRLSSQDDFDELILEILEILGHEALYPNYKMGEDLSSYITDLELPQPDDPFTTDVLPGWDEGEYMPLPEQEILAWLPEELHEHLGEMELHPTKEFIYRILPENEKIVVTTLEASGFQIRRDDSLIQKASGQ